MHALIIIMDVIVKMMLMNVKFPHAKMKDFVLILPEVSNVNALSLMLVMHANISMWAIARQIFAKMEVPVTHIDWVEDVFALWASLGDTVKTI